MAHQTSAVTPFDFIVDADERGFLNEAHRACTATRSWNALRLQSDWNPNVSRRAIQGMLADMDMSQHSGHSAAWTVAQLRCFARQGPQQYKTSYLHARTAEQQ